MRRDDRERWYEDVDLDRVRACPRCIGGAWIVVAILVTVLSLGPAAVHTVDDVRHQLASVRHVSVASLVKSVLPCDNAG